MKYRLIMFCTLFIVSPTVMAITQYDISVLMTGIEDGGKVIYIGLSPNPNTCQYGGIYFNDPVAIDKALGIALMAKTLNKKVRIDYIQKDGIGEKCIGHNIYVQ